MTEQQKSFNVIPQGQEQREIFYNRLNEIIGLMEEIESANESVKSIMERIAESHVQLHEDVKKADVKRRVKGMIDEYFKGKLTSNLEEAEEGLAEYEIAKKFLR